MQYVPRSYNAIAHSLAKIALNFETPVLWKESFLDDVMLFSKSFLDDVMLFSKFL